ncbi:sigma-54-dependent transcriptional regulator [Desulforhopalus singaporensis]|uniref:Sigma-54 interaction domain-containing protein n=1 Tax=Desulforhopalus singaporensis TaxID=91360 RepID=A0A1H0N4W5_9BACT|nr:sigma 54-interacting transcriptional regulator [Desulforhopalus singaporensis]SDO87535.1 Sigma-54 interaction domain-containing protein [Desulforhopalus singaporensis]
MRNQYRLDQKERKIFRVLAESAFANPFDARSLQLMYKLAGDRYPAGDILAGKVFARVTKYLDRVSQDGRIKWYRFAGEDRDLVRIATLRQIYHHCCVKFDDLIRLQVQTDHTPCHVPFAGDILRLLRQSGFSAEDSLLYFGFYYQLRRAWYFINQGLIGQSKPMEKLRSRLWASVFTSYPDWYEKTLWSRMEDFSTFLIGETGTGKGTAAAAIGRSGFIPFDENKGCFAESFTHNFIEINLSQFPESLIESELFGHKKGAFTGAVDNHQGVFALCSPHGSIFLDEIGDVSIPVQIKLLKVLEERRFSPVGDHAKLYFHGRVVTATNRSLEQLREEGRFREDFYYRLCSNVVPVPTLREQISSDEKTLSALLAHTVGKIVGGPAPDLLQTVLEVITKDVGPGYRWPGNVRELEQAVRSILITRHYHGTGDGGKEMDSLSGAMQNESVSVGELVSRYCMELYKRHGTFEKVAAITGLDPRTAKKHIRAAIRDREK